MLIRGLKGNSSQLMSFSQKKSHGRIHLNELCLVTESINRHKLKQHNSNLFIALLHLTANQYSTFEGCCCCFSSEACLLVICGLTTPLAWERPSRMKFTLVGLLAATCFALRWLMRGEPSSGNQASPVAYAPKPGQLLQSTKTVAARY